MRIVISYSAWKRVRHLLKCQRIPDTTTGMGKNMRNYITLLNTPYLYPRVHFLTKELKYPKRFIILHYHIDSDRHECDIYDPRIDKITNVLKNS